MKQSFLSIVCLTCVCFAAADARCENWPQWRGANFDGVSNETNIATSWGPEKNVVWRTALPGPAGATPVVWEDRIFLTTVDEQNLDLYCISTAGKLLWKRTVGKGNRTARGDEGNSASPSPATDGKHVWVFMGNGSLACYDMQGSEVWNFNVQDRYGKFKIQFGMTSTPVLADDRLYLQLIHGDGDPKTREAVVVALDKLTGKEVWKQPRPSDGKAECEHSYASPMLYRDQERSFLLTHGADYVVAHNLKDGSEIWRCGGLNLKGNYNPTLRFVASPAVSPGLIVVPSAKNGPVLGLRPGASGNVTHSTKALKWVRWNNTPDVPTPLIKDGLVYLCRENGNLICLDAASGEEYYNERTVRDRHRASPIYADGNIYLTGRKGIVTVVKAGKKFEILAKNDLGESISATPVVSGGTLYIRSFDALYAIRPDGK